MSKSYSPNRRSFVKSIAGLPLLGLAGSFNIHVRAADSKNPFASNLPQINAAREIGLGLLKPTAQQLAHGYRLHAESVVFESYGFAPRFASDEQAVAAEMKAGASAEQLGDLREEMLLARGATDAQQRRIFLEAFRASGVTCVFQNAGEEGNDPQRLLKRLARFTFLTDMMRDELFKAVKPDDIVAAKQQNKRCLYFSGNGVPLRQVWQSTRDEVRLIRIFQQLGIRMMHLTYNRRNPMGDGAGEPGNAGLSDFGQEVIAEMNRVGVIVDVAHSGWKTSAEAAKASSKPMVASHTTCAGLYKHFRGKPDDVVKAICDTGGLIGLCMIPRFLGGTGDIQAWLDHLDYAVKKFGPEHVAIGTDVAFMARSEPVTRPPAAPTGNSVPRPKAPARTPARWEHLWPVDPFHEKPHAIQSLAWTNWPLFTVGMVQRGHSDATIRKILGENMLRVARANFNG